MDRPKPRPLSPVYEEEQHDEREEQVRDKPRCGKPTRTDQTLQIDREVSSFDSESDLESDFEFDDEDDEDDDTLPIEIDVHGIKAKIFLNCADADIVPTRYLEKAERSPPLKRTPWIFRAAKDGRAVNISKWSKADIRFRGVFKTLKKVPPFTNGLFDTLTPLSALSSGSVFNSADGPSTIGPGRFRSGSDSRRSSRSSRYDFDEAVKVQGQVVYALLDEVLNMLDLRREAEDHRKWFMLKPRLLTCQPEYCTGYRIKHRDTPLTAGSVSLDFEPSRGIPRAVMPVATTTHRKNPLKPTLQDEFKLLLAQLLVNLYKLCPRGDKIPDQEAFLISLHGSRLHILRGIFPGQKTSMLWCGRHNPGNHLDDSQSAHAFFARMGCSSDNLDDNGNGNGSGNTDRKRTRFYSKTNLTRFIEQIEWNQLSDPSNEAHPRSFQVLGSREYDLWNKWEFNSAVKMLSGLMLYLMSGQARCGVLQDVFERYPYDEGFEVESEDDDDDGRNIREGERIDRGKREVEEEERRVEGMKKKAEEMMRITGRGARVDLNSVREKFEGFAGGLNLRQPWWDWVWEGGSSASASEGGLAGGAKDDGDGDVLMEGLDRQTRKNHDHW